MKTTDLSSFYVGELVQSVADRTLFLPRCRSVTSQTQFRVESSLTSLVSTLNVPLKQKHAAVASMPKEARRVEEGGGVELTCKLRPLKPAAVNRAVTTRLKRELLQRIAAVRWPKGATNILINFRKSCQPLKTEHMSPTVAFFPLRFGWMTGTQHVDGNISMFGASNIYSACTIMYSENKIQKYFHLQIHLLYHSILTLKSSSSSSRSSSMLFQLSLGTLITLRTVPLSEIQYNTTFFDMLFNMLPVLIILNVDWRESRSITCAYEHDVILSISSVDSVHSDLCEAVVHVGPDEDGPSAHGVHRVVHQRVVTRKLDHVIWETLRGLETAECLAGTLMEERKVWISHTFVDARLFHHGETWFVLSEFIGVTNWTLTHQLFQLAWNPLSYRPSDHSEVIIVWWVSGTWEGFSPGPESSLSVIEIPVLDFMNTKVHFSNMWYPCLMLLSFYFLLLLTQSIRSVLICVFPRFLLQTI